ncbi:MAG: cellulose synthase subunit BcsC-related outer membrane protein [Pseudomonadota bacterium]
MSTSSAAEVAKETGASEQLANQARYWEGQNRYDLARENWLKLLRSTPDSAAALAGLANAEAISGRAAAAQVYFDRLKAAHPNHPELRRLEAAIRQGSINQDKLTQPRALARQGKYQEAADGYLATFGGEPPSGRLGLEYYQTLAGTENGWEPARVGISKLAADNPEEPVYKLALAQHLTYRESSRRQGIADLSAMATGTSSVATPARQAWRQALIWLGAKRGDEALYQDYLKRYGSDAQVSARLATLRDPVRAAAVGGEDQPRVITQDELRGRVVKEGFEALNNSQLDVATERFENAISQYGESADALGGLGIVRLRQQAYPEAQGLLERATSKDSKRAARWKEALDTARFWQSVRGAEAARKAGDSSVAERELRRAISRDPKRAGEELSVPLSLADILAEQGDSREAEKIYRDVLRRDPENVDALRGLIGVLTRSQRLPEAIALAERAPENIRSQLGSFGVLKAQALREQAALAVTAKDDARAEGLLKEALLLDPESAWTRLDLARIYQRESRIREANTLVDNLLASANGSGPVNPDVLFIKASLLAEQQDFFAGLEILEQVPAASRTPAMTELQKRLWVRYQTQRAGVYSRAGSPQEAQQILSEVEPFVGEMPELLGAMATAYADLGDEARALRYMRQALTRNAQSDSGLRLAYASLLFKLRQDTEFEVVMDDLLRRGKLTEQQNLDLANLRIGYRLRQADLVREDGDLARAYEYLEPLIRVNPSDPRLMMALARLYADSKDLDKAYVIYDRVLQQNPNELDAIKGAAGAALAMNRLDDSDAMLERAFAIDPNNPRLYALAGRAARARGDEGRALSLFQQALRLDAAQSQSAQAGTAAPTGSGNSQPLLQLIDPASSYQRAPARVVGAVSAPVKVAARSSGSFFKTRANPALRPAAKKKVAPLLLAVKRQSAKPAVAGLYKATYRLPRGDVSLPARRPHLRGGFIKVSTPPQTGAAQPARGTVEQPSGYWAEQPGSNGAAPTYKYVESLTLSPPTIRSSTATKSQVQPYQAPVSDFPPPRRVNPAMSLRLSRPSSSLREEVGSEIRELNGTAGAYGATPVYEVPRMDGGYGSVPAPIYAAPGYVPTVPVAPKSAVISSDPMLATPDFVLDRNRVESKDRRDLLKEIGELRSSRTPYVQTGLALRSRDGSEGLDRLYDVEAPVEISFPANEGGRLKFRAVPVYLDAGTVSGRNLPVYGALGLALATEQASPTLRYDNSESGIAVGAAYEAGDFKLDVGSSPLGMPVENIVGGINWRPKSGDLSFKVDVARRSVTDSLLSYAGVRDPATGFTYGGVTKTGGRLDLAYDLGKYGVYANGGYQIYNGENVPQNSAVEVGAGLYARAIETRGNRVTYGLNVTTFGYDKNLRRFSLGHGGYFSPQSYLAVSVPVEWEGYRNRFSYKLGGALGIQAFKEDGQGQYPADEGLQGALEEALTTYEGDLPIVGGYPSKRQTGVGFTVTGQFEYLLDTNLAVGARLALDNARDYNEASASGYLRYMFYPQTRVSFPPNLLLPYFNHGDPRL